MLLFRSYFFFFVRAHVRVCVCDTCLAHIFIFAYQLFLRDHLNFKWTEYVFLLNGGVCSTLSMTLYVFLHSIAHVNTPTFHIIHGRHPWNDWGSGSASPWVCLWHEMDESYVTGACILLWSGSWLMACCTNSVHPLTTHIKAGFFFIQHYLACKWFSHFYGLHVG